MEWLPGKAGGTLYKAFISSIRLGVRQGDDVIIVTLIGLHGSVENRAGVQWGSEAVDPWQAGLGPQDGWMVAPQKFLIYLLVLLLGRAGNKEKGWYEMSNVLENLRPT